MQIVNNAYVMDAKKKTVIHTTQPKLVPGETGTPPWGFGAPARRAVQRQRDPCAPLKCSEKGLYVFHAEIYLPGILPLYSTGCT
ncbi:hypothetical protein CB1_000568007 [Camelus ferus]|nr:hypothetical protein CB1_000568007 [Camelus ferus]